MTVVLGIDPGAVDTGLVIIDDAIGDLRRCMLGAFTVHRDTKIVNAAGVITVDRGYQLRVNASILDAIRTFEPEAMAYETLKKPTGFANGKKHLLDPTPSTATGYVIGSITGREWPVELVEVMPGGNGSNLTWNLYPELIRMKQGGKGSDNKRHMRSAFDVALRMKQARALVQRGR